MGHGTVPTGHPLFVPVTVGRDLWAEADVVLGIGSRLEWPLTRWGVDPQLTLIKVDVDPDELDRHGATTVGIVGDAAGVSAALANALRGGPVRPDRRAEVADRRRAFEVELDRLRPSSTTSPPSATSCPTTACWSRTSRRSASPPTSGSTSAGRGPSCRAARPARSARASPWASAPGRAARPPRRRRGRGRRLPVHGQRAGHGRPARHPLVTMVFDDGAYGNVRRIQEQRFGPDRTIASRLRTPTSWPSPRAWRARTPRPDDRRGPAAAQRAFAHGGPAVVVVDSGPMPDPWPFFLRGPVRGRA
jgi:acetolactate synthase-1/2/3 large subunit